MKRHLMRLTFTLIIFWGIWLLPAKAMASIADYTADLELGQNDYTHTGVDIVSGNELYWPTDVAIDTTSGRVYVCDTMNQRILWWNNMSSLRNGKSADGILGSVNFYGDWQNTGNGNWFGVAMGICVDGSGNLWVADTYNNRVLKFTAPSANNQSPSLVLGQADFATYNSGCSQNSLFSPYGVKADSFGNIWVADSGNNRILKFSNPSVNGQAASLVLGQTDFNLNASTCSQTGLNGPRRICFDSSGNIWVTDTVNYRVLKYSYPMSSGMAASVVVGQSDFSSSGLNGSIQSELCYPSGVSVDRNGNLWVSDNGGSRILKYPSPITSGMSANLVLGQSGWSSIRTNNTTL